jgi:hypothetical protein
LARAGIEQRKTANEVDYKNRKHKRFGFTPKGDTIPPRGDTIVLSKNDQPKGKEDAERRPADEKGSR